MLPHPPDANANPLDAEREALASLRSMRTLLVLCVLVPLLLFAAFAAYRYRQVHAEAEVRADRALRVAREHALKVLETNDTLLRHALDLVEGGVRSTLHRQLESLARDKEQLQSIWVSDATGRPFASNLFESFPASLSFADREYFRWHRAQPRPGGVYFSEVLVGKLTHTRFFDMSRAWRDANGAFAGVVSVSVAPEYFLRFHEDLSIAEPGLSVAMFRQDGVMYARWPQKDPPLQRIPADAPVLGPVQRGDASGAVRAKSSIDGLERLTLFTRLGNYPVYVGTALELGAVTAQWRREMALIGALAAVPVLGLLLAGLAAMKRARLSLAAARRLHQEIDARRQAEEALRQSQKMEAMGRLTGGVAHDFNNALMVISANMHLLRRRFPQVEGRQTESIERAVTGAANLTRQLLAFSRRQALLPQVVRLQDKLPSLKDMLSPLLGSPVELEILVDEDTAPIEVDVAELELALINLAVNAKDAMASGGRFSVRARNDAAPAGADGPAVIVEASDSGAGIAPDVLARVFEPFFTTKPVGQGTGLGLSQVYGLCQRSGGSARIASELGRGTTVTMVFPRSRRQPADEGARDAGGDSRFDLRILLVEDNPDVAAAIRPMLRSMGCEVTHFAAAVPALRWIDTHAGEVDLVLTDVVMPGELDGLELAQHVRRRHPRIGLVVMTGYAQHLETLDREGFTVLAKPWSPENLARVLRAEAAPKQARTA